MNVRCPCGEYHEVPESLQEACTDWDTHVTVAFLGRGSYRIPKVFLYNHGADFDDIPDMAGQYGFQRMSSV